jgi:hypothetical protein
MIDLGSLRLEFLLFSTGTIVIQRNYTIQNRSEFQGHNPATVPMVENQHLILDMAAPPTDHGLYKRILGKLNFLFQIHLDLQYTLNSLSRFAHSPQKPHLDAICHFLCYLQGTVDLGLLYRRGEDSLITGYNDSDWAGDRNDRKSTTRYLFLLGSTPITWRSQKQPCVALSSIEAEYVALSSCTKEGIWLRKLLCKLKFLFESPKNPTKIFCDNQSAIKLSGNPIFHARTKYIETQYHYIWEKVESDELTVTHIPTGNQIANSFTKPLGRTLFEKQRDQLGLVYSNHIPTNKP